MDQQDIDKIKEIDKALTKMVVLHEWTMRIMSTQIGLPFYKHALKQYFNQSLKAGERLNNSLRQFLRSQKKDQDQEELYDTESDFWFDLGEIAFDYKTINSQKQLIEFAKKLRNEELKESCINYEC